MKYYFLQVIPTLAHYSDIVSDIPSGSVYIYMYFSDILSDIIYGIYFDILWGRAVPTDIWSSQLRSEAAGGVEKGEGGSNSDSIYRDPHLAGGEIQTFDKWYIWTWSERQVKTTSMILCSQIIAYKL